MKSTVLDIPQSFLYACMIQFEIKQTQNVIILLPIDLLSFVLILSFNTERDWYCRHYGFEILQMDTIYFEVISIEVYHLKRNFY